MYRIPEVYDRINVAEGRSAISTGSRIMEFGTDAGDSFTVYEGIRGGFVDQYHPSDAADKLKFYELNPQRVAETVFSVVANARICA